MRLPQPQLESPCFLFDTATDLIQALGSECSAVEAEEINRLYELGLPPITSVAALSTMLGYNPGFTRSLVYRTHRHYRHFSIKKGKGERIIHAPKVGLKAVQKWISIHFQKFWTPPDCVYGFIPGRSHIDAASRHTQSEWVFSIDIHNFFPSVPASRVRAALGMLGYKKEDSLDIITLLACYNSALAQGAPTSPVISNIVLHNIDNILANIAKEGGFTYTRYADDMVFSGRGDISPETIGTIKKVVKNDGWDLSEHKEELSKLPKRLKVHGLLVHGGQVRLTKGYRNKIRAYKHLLNSGRVKDTDIAKISGHLNYAAFVSRIRGDEA